MCFRHRGTSRSALLPLEGTLEPSRCEVWPQARRSQHRLVCVDWGKAMPRPRCCKTACRSIRQGWRNPLSRRGESLSAAGIKLLNRTPPTTATASAVAHPDLTACFQCGSEHEIGVFFCFCFCRGIRFAKCYAPTRIWH